MFYDVVTYDVVAYDIVAHDSIIACDESTGGAVDKRSSPISVTRARFPY